MAKEKEVTNGGSAIGEAIGDLLETQVHQTFEEIANKKHFCFHRSLGTTKGGKKSKKLLLSDEFGNEYNMDGLVTDKAGHPMILIESKYIRYKKHNRDKASWICNAHSAVRRNYPSIRSSIAVLAGNWSKSSLEMLESYGVKYFMVPFDQICRILDDYGVDFEWEENDYAKALKAWKDFSALSDAKKEQIGSKMIAIVKDDLVKYVKNILGDKPIRKLKKIVIELHTNKNEVFKHVFDSKEDASEFLSEFDNKFDETQFKSIN